MKRKKAQVERPAVDRAADANVSELVRQIEAERPKQETLADKVKQVLGK